jgi:hypothetical protein
MKDRNEIEPGDPEMFNALSKLRGIEPSQASRIRNRVAVGEALRALSGEEAEPARPVSWWRRSISIPLPLAACALLAFALLGAIALRSGDARNAEVRPAEQTQTKIEPVDLAAAESPPALVYRASATYLCGIGQIQSTHGYFFTEKK